MMGRCWETDECLCCACGCSTTPAPPNEEAIELRLLYEWESSDPSVDGVSLLLGQPSVHVDGLGWADESPPTISCMKDGNNGKGDGVLSSTEKLVPGRDINDAGGAWMGIANELREVADEGGEGLPLHGALSNAWNGINPPKLKSPARAERGVNAGASLFRASR